MAREANWEERSYWKLGPNFGMDVKNPQLGSNGPDVYTLYGVTGDKDICIHGLTDGSGMFKICNDRSIQIIAGQNNSGGGVDIVIAGKNGDVTITAENASVVVVLTDVSGKAVYSNNLGTVNGMKNLNINTANFANGIYMVNVTSNGTVTTQKLVVRN